MFWFGFWCGIELKCSVKRTRNVCNTLLNAFTSGFSRLPFAVAATEETHLPSSSVCLLMYRVWNTAHAKLLLRNIEQERRCSGFYCNTIFNCHWHELKQRWQLLIWFLVTIKPINHTHDGKTTGFQGLSFIINALSHTPTHEQELEILSGGYKSIDVFVNVQTKI